MKKYEDYQQTDKRKNVQRYFQLFAAKFKWEDGDKKEATRDFEAMDRAVFADTANEKLFIARLYEALSKSYEGKDEGKFQLYSNAVMNYYPQLIPFSGIKASVNLSVLGVDDAVTKKVIDDLKDCNIQFNSGNSIANADIAFIKKGQTYEALINVRTMDGKIVANKGAIIFKKPEGVGGEIGLRIFGKGNGTVMFEPPPKPEFKNDQLKK
jgi:hypothetical protein